MNYNSDTQLQWLKEKNEKTHCTKTKATYEVGICIITLLKEITNKDKIKD